MSLTQAGLENAGQVPQRRICDAVTFPPQLAPSARPWLCPARHAGLSLRTGPAVLLREWSTRNPDVGALPQ